MNNLDILKRFSELVQDEFMVVKTEEDAKEALARIMYSASILSRRVSGLSNKEQYPHLVLDIDYILDGNFENVELTDEDYEAIIDCLLDYDYSDYNEYIADKIREIKGIQEETETENEFDSFLEK